MSIISWLREVTGGGAAAKLLEQPLHFTEEQLQLHDLDLNEVLDTHMVWPKRLESILTGDSSESFDLATIASDCECTLGKWLHGPAKESLNNSIDYQDLFEIHADFHLNTAEVIKDHLHERGESAWLNLRKLRIQSGMMQLALVRLFPEKKS